MCVAEGVRWGLRVSLAQIKSETPDPLRFFTGEVRLIPESIRAELQGWETSVL